MIVRYVVLVFDEDTTFDWHWAYQGEFSDLDSACAAARATLAEANADRWQVIDLMSKKVVYEGTYRDLRHESKAKTEPRQG